LGGNGFVEENGLARLYREAPLNSIWEGSGNVNALDVVRAVTREPQALEALHKELSLAHGVDARLDAAIDRAVGTAHDLASGEPADAQAGARSAVELLATTLQASLLIRYAPAYVADLFVASRLDGRHGHTFGTLSPEAVRATGTQVVDRALAG